MDSEFIRLNDDFDNKEYSIIEIKKGNLDNLKKLIKQVKKRKEWDYDSIETAIEKQEYFIKYVTPDYEVSF
jgi:hypothetical protein